MATFDELRMQTVAALEPLAEKWLFPENPEPQNRKPTDEYLKFLKSYQSMELAEDSDLSWSCAELNELQKCNDEAKLVSDRLQNSKVSLSELKTRYESVAEKTSSLHEACDQLMADQTRLASAAEDIRSRLDYFDHVEQIMQKLGSPHLSVTGETFTHMLTTVDQCMQFLKEQPDYKESSIYYAKYQQCLSRALSAAKSYVTQNLQETSEAIKAKQTADPAGDDTFTLYYGMFATHAQAVRALMETLEHRWEKAPEYQSVLYDCYNAYFWQRDQLLRPSVSATVTQLLKKYTGSSCTLTRTGCNFLLRLCEDEYRLFFQFFTRPSELLHDFTERMCTVFYDGIRALIIHIPHLETLAELCAILKVEMLEERCAVESDLYVGFVRVVSELVGDVAERLVHRAVMYAQSDILKYNPAPGDLAYPEKLIMMQDIAQSSNKAANELHRQGSVGSIESITSQEVAGIVGSAQQPLSAVDLHGLWYPTVRRTVLCLSKLYKCMDETVFHGVSQEILFMCVQSMQSATAKIVANKKPLDAQLFLIKHLLILREQTSPFRVSANATVKDTTIDFGKMKDSAVNLFQHNRSRWFTLNSNNAFLEFLFQVPAVHVSEHLTDSRRILDIQLRDACQKLISFCADNVIFELSDFLQKADVVLSMGREGSSAGSAVSLAKQPFANTDNLNKLSSQAYRKLKDFIPLVRISFALYLANRETENILFNPIRKKISDAFTKFQEMVKNNYTEEEKQIISCPSSEELNLIFNVAPSH